MNIPVDENSVPVIAGVSEIDEESVITIYVNPVTHGLVVEVV